MKKILAILISILFVFSIAGCASTAVVTETTTQAVEEATEPVSEEVPDEVPDERLEEIAQENEVTVSDEVVEMSEGTKDDVANEVDLSTDEVFVSDEVDEESLEEDGVVEQEDISYDGDTDGSGVELLGAWQGITYYAQNDTRWAKTLYTSCGNSSQTMKSSGCGPTSAAMVVSSSKGAILPTTMAQLYVDNGFRTKSNGTAWAAFAFTADYFDFEEFYTTTSYDTVLKYLKTDKNNDGVPDYFVIMSCGSGLWTTGGHYVAILHMNGDLVGVSDPYPYGGKYYTASRKGAGVTMRGNIAYLTTAKFKSHSNMKRAWIFSNDHQEATPDPKPSSGSSSSTTTNTKVEYTRYIATESKALNVRSGPGTNYKIVDTVKKGTKVTVYEVSGSWSRIGTGRWVSSGYLSSTPVNVTSNTPVVSSASYKTVIGKTYSFKSATTLYSKGNKTGTKYNYKAGTKAKILSHYSTTVDYVYISATHRYAYVDVSAFNTNTGLSPSSSGYKSVTGKKYTLKSTTKLYSKGNLTGTVYTYKAGTTVTVLSHYSKTVDKVKVNATGRVAYVSVSAYK